MLCAILSCGVKALTILTVDIALNSRKVTQYQAKQVILALKREPGNGNRETENRKFISLCFWHQRPQEANESPMGR